MQTITLRLEEIKQHEKDIALFKELLLQGKADENEELKNKILIYITKIQILIEAIKEDLETLQKEYIEVYENI